MFTMLYKSPGRLRIGRYRLDIKVIDHADLEKWKSEGWFESPDEAARVAAATDPAAGKKTQPTIQSSQVSALEEADDDDEEEIEEEVEEEDEQGEVKKVVKKRKVRKRKKKEG